MTVLQAVELDPFAESMYVFAAEAALRRLGAVSRRDAWRWLERSGDFAHLIEAERVAVTQRFPVMGAHAWWPSRDEATMENVWRCTCGMEVRQPFDKETLPPEERELPRVLLTHPDEFTITSRGNR